jgi:hypothetical protein
MPCYVTNIYQQTNHQAITVITFVLATQQKTLGELESMDNHHDTVSKVKQVNERATLFRITSTAMINVSWNPCTYCIVAFNSL